MKEYVVPNTFKIHIQKARLDRQRRQCFKHVQLDDMLDHNIWNGLYFVQYQIIPGYSENIEILFLQGSTP
jgi:hypothetical protein